MYRKLLVATTVLSAALFSGGCASKDASLVKPRQVVIDVRTPAEQQETGYIMGALLMEHTTIHTEIKKAVPDTATPIAVYCRSGRRAEMAKSTLNSIGYSDVTNLGGLEEAAKTLSAPVVKLK
jgi:phage shock protein E